MCVYGQVLRVAHNQLAEIPSSIAALTALTLLDLSHNALSSLTHLDTLTGLTHLDVSGLRMPCGPHDSLETCARVCLCVCLSVSLRVCASVCASRLVVCVGRARI